MKILLTNTFRRAAKKLHRSQVLKLEAAIEQVKNDPMIGELKVGDLMGVRVYKFHIFHQLILLAYTYEESLDALSMISFAPHENFYQDLKNQLKKH